MVIYKLALGKPCLWTPWKEPPLKLSQNKMNAAGHSVSVSKTELQLMSSWQITSVHLGWMSLVWPRSTCQVDEFPFSLFVISTYLRRICTFNPFRGGNQAMGKVASFGQAPCVFLPFTHERCYRPDRFVCSVCLMFCRAIAMVCTSTYKGFAWKYWS